MKKIIATVTAALSAIMLTGCSSLLGTTTAASANAEGESGIGSWFWVVYIVIIGAFVYFMMIRPSKKQKKEQAELYSSMAIGDSVLTTSGFYGVIIDLTDDTVIVEFGSNKNCRIPMQKQAIVQVEKPDYTNTSSDDNK